MDTFRSNIAAIYGEAGKQWLERLPEIVTYVACKYHLSDLKAVPNLTYNYVLSGWQETKPIILKLGMDVQGLVREAVALRAFAGRGCVKVIANEEGVLLLERAVPGNSLKSYFPIQEADSVKIAVTVMQALHQACLSSSHNFPHIKEWLKGLDRHYDDIPSPHLQKAKHLKDKLLRHSHDEVLLHGDLHHDNILKDGKEWLAIDPKGVIGDPAYEIAAFIRNPLPALLMTKDPVTIIRNRISLVATEGNLPAHHLIDWSFVQAVLAWVWALEDNCDPTYFKLLTEIFEGLS